MIAKSNCNLYNEYIQKYIPLFDKFKLKLKETILNNDLGFYLEKEENLNEEDNIRYKIINSDIPRTDFSPIKIENEELFFIRNVNDNRNIICTTSKLDYKSFMLRETMFPNFTFELADCNDFSYLFYYLYKCCDKLDIKFLSDFDGELIDAIRQMEKDIFLMHEEEKKLFHIRKNYIFYCKIGDYRDRLLFYDLNKNFDGFSNAIFYYSESTRIPKIDESKFDNSFYLFDCFYNLYLIFKKLGCNLVNGDEMAIFIKTMLRAKRNIMLRNFSFLENNLKDENLIIELKNRNYR